MPRKLRIAVSVFFGVACLAMAALCLSLLFLGETLELMNRNGPGPAFIGIGDGHLLLSWNPRAQYRPTWAGQIGRYGFRYNVYSNGSRNLLAPLGTLGGIFALVGAITAATAWVRWTYSLRTLLIAMTLVAVALGLAVWAER